LQTINRLSSERDIVPLEVTSVSSEDLQPSVIDKHILMRGNAEIFITEYIFLKIITTIKKD